MRGSGSSSSSSQHRERCGLWRAESSGGSAESATQLRMFEAGVSGDQRWPLFHPETCSSCENKTWCQSLWRVSPLSLIYRDWKRQKIVNFKLNICVILSPERRKLPELFRDENHGDTFSLCAPKCPNNTENNDSHGIWFYPGAFFKYCKI